LTICSITRAWRNFVVACESRIALVPTVTLPYLIQGSPSQRFACAERGCGGAVHPDHERHLRRSARRGELWPSKHGMLRSVRFDSKCVLLARMRPIPDIGSYPKYPLAANAVLPHVNEAVDAWLFTCRCLPDWRCLRTQFLRQSRLVVRPARLWWTRAWSARRRRSCSRPRT